jgi:hypothetical protein
MRNPSGQHRRAHSVFVNVGPDDLSSSKIGKVRTYGSSMTTIVSILLVCIERVRVHHEMRIPLTSGTEDAQNPAKSILGVCLTTAWHLALFIKGSMKIMVGSSRKEVASINHIPFKQSTNWRYSKDC